MTPRVATLSALFGVAWHAIVVMLIMRRGLREALSPSLIAGALAGLCAGFLTIRSRERRLGQESVLDAVVAYYLAVLAYAVSFVWIGLLTGVDPSGKTMGVLDAFAVTWVAVWYSILYATLMGIVLIPLSFLTRHLLWRFSGRMRPNSA